eukprot:scaffold265757_cov31-Tisochrysis_lutea.AAC.1
MPRPAGRGKVPYGGTGGWCARTCFRSPPPGWNCPWISTQNAPGIPRPKLQAVHPSFISATAPPSGNVITAATSRAGQRRQLATELGHHKGRAVVVAGLLEALKHPLRARVVVCPLERFDRRTSAKGARKAAAPQWRKTRKVADSL